MGALDADLSSKKGVRPATSDWGRDNLRHLQDERGGYLGVKSTAFDKTESALKSRVSQWKCEGEREVLPRYREIKKEA